MFLFLKIFLNFFYFKKKHYFEFFQNFLKSFFETFLKTFLTTFFTFLKLFSFF